MSPGSGDAMTLRIFPRYLPGLRIAHVVRWLAPPANFRQTSGLLELRFVTLVIASR
jgi:hypothetical protein